MHKTNLEQFWDENKEKVLNSCEFRTFLHEPNFLLVEISGIEPLTS